MVEQQIIKK